MISNIAIVLLAAHTVAGAAIKRNEPTTSCTDGQTASSALATGLSTTVPFYSAVVPSSAPVVSSYSAVVPSSSASLSSSVVLESSIPTLSSYPVGIPSSTPLTSFTGDISSVASSIASSALSSSLSSSIYSNSSIISSTTPALSTLTYSNTTSRSALVSTVSSILLTSSATPSGLALASSSLTPIPQSSGYIVGQPSSTVFSSGTSLIAVSPVSSSPGCIAAFTQTVYVTASVPTTTMEMLTTVQTTSTATVTLSASSSIQKLSKLVPTPVPQSSGYPVGQQSSDLGSSSPVPTITETSVLPSVSFNSVSIPASSGTPVDVQNSAPASVPASSSATPSSPVVPSPSLPGFSYPASTPGQPTASFYTGAPPLSYGVNNSTGAYPTGTTTSASLTISTGYGPVVSTNIISNSVPVSTGSYSMATSSTPVLPSSSSAVAPSSSVFSSPTQGYQTAVLSLTTTTSHSIVMVVPTSTNGPQYKRDVATVNLAVPATRSLVSSTLKPSNAPNSSSKPTSSTFERITNAPKPKSSSKSSVGDEAKTIVVSQDPRCPYPYPGIYCGEPSTTVISVKAAPTLMQSAKKTGSVVWCPYSYPGGKGEACP
ncbi:hypothetical protein PMIN04_001686 [Paraphaeosphaeria minitans]